MQTWEPPPTTTWWGIAKLKCTGGGPINRSGPRREPPTTPVSLVSRSQYAFLCLVFLPI
jgi:hypothetical protein